MATKSILKNIRIKDKPFGRSLANALETAKSNSKKSVEFERTPIRVKKEDIKDFFQKASKT